MVTISELTQETVFCDIRVCMLLASTFQTTTSTYYVQHRSSRVTTTLLHQLLESNQFNRFAVS